MAAAVAGEEIGLTALHELEMATALELKVFRSEATPEQAAAALRAVSPLHHRAAQGAAA